MSLSKDAALEILGLPSFATGGFILQRYKYLALEWFPEKHCNSEYSIEVFGNITRAALILIQPGKDHSGLDLEDMYSFFQHVFFGGSGKHDKEVGAGCDCDHEHSDSSTNAYEDEFRKIVEKEEIKAASKATELIQEEEEEKAKSERRKAKKKRRKEKKKSEKADTKKKEEEQGQKKQSNDSAKKKTKKGEVLKVSDSEEDLDPSSAFVSVVAKKHRKQIPGLQPKQEMVIDPSYHYTPDLPEDEDEEDHEIIIIKSRQIALEGNAKANEGRYSDAVELFSESIRLDPSDHRFYGNRSYCYDRLGMFDKALKDAEKSIKMCPVWPKGYFRKGRALLGLKKYAQAEKYFVDVLKLDNDCEDAISELRKAKLLQIMEKGYTKEIADAALSRHGTVSEALASLLSSGISRIEVKDDLDIFISDDEIENVDKTPPKPKPKPVSQPLPPAALSPYYDIKRDPKNPEGHNSIWIGNVQPDVTEKKLTQMFGKYGELISVKVMPEKFCAFINYKSKLCPGKAMEAYQGFELSGKNLIIRFPNLPGEAAPSAIPPAKKKPGVIGQELKKMGPVNDDECYFWRTTGCIYGEVCRYKHIKEHKGIDKKTWQVT